MIEIIIGAFIAIAGLGLWALISLGFSHDREEYSKRTLAKYK